MPCGAGGGGGGGGGGAAPPFHFSPPLFAPIDNMTAHDTHTVTKRDLVQRISDTTGQTKVLVRDIVQQFLDEVSNELVQGNRLEFRKFGVFEVRSRPGRIAQNPKTLEKVQVPPKQVVKFKVGNILKKRVEKGEVIPASEPTDVPFSAESVVRSSSVEQVSTPPSEVPSSEGERFGG